MLAMLQGKGGERAAAGRRKGERSEIKNGREAALRLEATGGSVATDRCGKRQGRFPTYRSPKGAQRPQPVGRERERGSVATERSERGAKGRGGGPALSARAGGDPPERRKSEAMRPPH